MNTTAKAVISVNIVVALVLLFLIAVPALASNVHFVEGPVVTATSTAVTTSGKLAGLGNKGVTLVQSIDVAVTCANPGQNSDVPGQRQSFTSTVTNLHPDKFGNLVFSITTDIGDLSGSCPNPQWTPSGTLVSGTLDVYQGGKLVLQVPLV
jgi:hypothetical protein